MIPNPIPNVKAPFVDPQTRSINIAQKPHIIGSLGPKALKYEPFEGKERPLHKVLKLIPYRSLIEALYTLNSPPVVSFNQQPKDPKPKP